MGNRKRLRYDTGVVVDGVAEATVVMDWANELRKHLQAAGHKVIRTRVDENDPAPISRRDDIARAYGADIMISLHCNYGSTKGGAETFYRGEEDRAFAVTLTNAVSQAMGTLNRGAKTEKESQHPSLAVMEFRNCWLIELGFLTSLEDRAKLLDQAVKWRTCKALAAALDTWKPN